jgi:small-conductance mechanosensitive channel
MESFGIDGSLADLIGPIIKWMREIGFAFSGPGVNWTIAQVIGIGVAWLVAATLRRRAAASVEGYLKSTLDQTRLHVALTLTVQRMRAVVFTLLLWGILLVMRAATWPSRSQIVLSAASLATAWLVISLVSKLIRNRTVSKVVALAAWSIAALNIVGLLPQAVEFLDSVAFETKDFRLSLLVILKGIVSVSVLLWLAVTVGQFVDRRVRESRDLTPSLKVLIGKLARMVLIAIAIVAGLNIVGVDLTAFAVFSGAIGLGLGFGLQKVISNLISGMILLADKSIKPGDVISVEGTFGRISQLSARYVAVVARDGREYLIPNEDLITNKVINWSFTAPWVRLDVAFGVSYDADPHEVRELAKAAAKTHERVIADPAPVCHITAYGDSAVEYLLRFWIIDPESGVTNVKGDVYLALWDALKEAGVSIPYPHRQVIISSPVSVELKRPAKDA